MDGLVEKLAANLAANLRTARTQRGLTQGQLAKLCDVPRSTIANIETGLSNPTLAVLARIAAALRLSLEELLSAPRGRFQLFPRGSLPVTARGRGRRVKVQRLLPHPVPGMEIDRLELPAGERFIGTPHRPGTQEYLYCERGRITVWVSGERFDVGEGDVAAFPGDQPHSYHNEGHGMAVGFSVVALAPIGS